jgi:hypothetical protein
MFHPARRDSCYLALLRLEGNQAVVASGSGAPLRVDPAELDRLWTRHAIFLWRDFEAVSRQGVPREAWARRVLGQLGYPAEGRSLLPALARFQRDTDLAPDGVIGNRTLMTLYSLGDYPRPRLGSRAAAAHSASAGAPAVPGPSSGETP